MEDRTFEEFLEVVEQLEPEARRDVVDVAVFIAWKQTRKPAPWRSAIRGGWLYLLFKLKKYLSA